VAIVEASTVLTSDQKRLYRRYVELDRPKGYKTGGCFAKVPTIARRLGVAPGSVKRNRRILCQYGLLASTPEGVTPIRWFPTLPPWVTCIRPATVAKGRATDAWIMDQSAQLDAVLSAQVSEMKRAKGARRPRNGAQDGNPFDRQIVRQADSAELPRNFRADDSGALDTICTPERNDLYLQGAQIVPSEDTNCTPTAAASVAGRSGKALAA
jgi:hypothetical protein